ncbi:hypothetical protein AB0L59_20410 [Streptomyces sp. NPDC052109]|uniref:hypothetical protein n=1 Tax=Streptomyces sp. NPDC052109 TaxID=3155527 RepID=UPI0034483108
MDIYATYARPNALARAIPNGVMSENFHSLWDRASEHKLAGAFKASIVEEVMNLIIDLYQLPLLEQLSQPKVGEWFYHVGSVRFRRTGSDTRQISIPLTGKTWVGTLWDENMLTTSSSHHMKNLMTNGIVIGCVTSETDADIFAVGRENILGTTGISETAKIITGSDTFAGPDALSDVISMLLSRYQEAISHTRGHQLLKGDQEEDCQVLFDILAKYSGTEVEVHREVETGVGPVDFVISGYGQQHALEFKVDRKRTDTLKHGLCCQLPSYLNARGYHQGWYVVIVSNQATGSGRSQEVFDFLNEQDFPAEIHIRVIDGRRQESASKRKDVIPTAEAR